MSEPVSVLVVAHQTAASGALVQAVRERAGEGSVRFHLVVPRRAHGMQRVVDPLEADESEAQAVLDEALPLLSQAAGADVSGSIGDPEPLMAIEDAVNLGRYHEIIVSTLPLGVSRWVKLDLVSKARALGLPVTHVVATSDDHAGAALS
jgi:hypothetical protein